jgi:chloramphenicol-sensitive protein RarD
MSPPQDESNRALRGALAALLSFLMWGIFPIYWKVLERFNAVELIAHRVVWTSLSMFVILLFRQDARRACRAAITSPRQAGLCLVSGGLLTVNWFVFVWAVNHDYVIESSLGYFLVPIFQVGIGAWMFGERLRVPQWAAIGFAAVGVGLLLARAGGVPWVALVLAVSWVLYTLMRKHSLLGSDEGLFVETLFYLPLAAGYLAWRQHLGAAILSQIDAPTLILVLCMGWLTAVPLILYTYGARRLRLSTLGLLQYVAPTGQFLTGLLAFHEQFDGARLRACLFIWCGLAIYTADSFWAQRRSIRGLAVG